MKEEVNDGANAKATQSPVVAAAGVGGADPAVGCVPGPGGGAGAARPVVQPPIPVSFAPVPRPPLAMLRPGAAVTIRIRQVFPRDGFSPAVRCSTASRRSNRATTSWPK